MLKCSRQTETYIWTLESCDDSEIIIRAQNASGYQKWIQWGSLLHFTSGCGDNKEELSNLKYIFEIFIFSHVVQANWVFIYKCGICFHFQTVGHICFTGCTRKSTFWKSSCFVCLENTDMAVVFTLDFAHPAIGIGLMHRWLSVLILSHRTDIMCISMLPSDHIYDCILSSLFSSTCE